jgi:hypothetical protein
MKKTPYQKIMRAYRRGTGLRLTAEEIEQLAQDDAISVAAANDDDFQEDPELYAAEQAIYNAVHNSEEQFQARKHFHELLKERA